MTQTTNYTKLVIIYIFAIGVFNIFYNISFPLHYDEVYYWWISKHLDLSFFDIPTMLPYMIKLATLFGDESWQIRLVGVFCISVSSFVFYLLISDIYDKKVAFFTIFTILLLPHTQAGYSVTTTDMPFLLFFILSIFSGYKVIFYGEKRYYN